MCGCVSGRWESVRPGVRAVLKAYHVSSAMQCALCKWGRYKVRRTVASVLAMAVTRLS